MNLDETRGLRALAPTRTPRPACLAGLGSSVAVIHQCQGPKAGGQRASYSAGVRVLVNKPALGQGRGTSFAHRLTAKSATCPFPVAKHCCKSTALAHSCHVSRTEPNAGYWMPSEPIGFARDLQFFLLRAVSGKAASWQQARSARKLAKKKQLQLSVKQTASKHLASDRRDWGTQAGKRETHLTAETGRHNATRGQRHSIWHLSAELGRHSISHERSGGHDPGRHSIWHLPASQQGDKRETRTRSQRETRPPSRRHSIWQRPWSRRHSILYTSS